MDINIPVVFVSCSNNQESPLRELRGEMQDIWLAMDEFDSRGVIKFDHPPYDADTTFLLQKIRRIGERLSILHYSGHANDHLFRMQNGDFSIDQLLALLSGKKPYLVFLNGCSTYGYVDALLAHGVKAVIATTSEVKDISARLFATEFYKSLAASKSLKVAFDEAKASSPSLSVTKATPRQQMGWGELSVSEKIKPCPWGLYHLDEPAEYNQLNEFISILDWVLIPSDKATLRLPPSFQQQRASIIELIRQRDAFAKTLRRVETDLRVYKILPPDKWDDDMREQFSEKEREKKEAEAGIDERVGKIEEQRLVFGNRLRQSEENKVANRLIEPVSLLNYSTPREAVSTWLEGKQQQSLLFMLQGTSACGLPLLQARILNRLRFQFDSEELCLRIAIECRSASQSAVTESTLWEKLQEHRNVGGITPEEAVANLFNQLYTADIDSRNLLLIIKDALQCSQVVYILNFWATFSQLIANQPGYSHWSQLKKRVVLIVRYEAQNSETELVIPQQQIYELSPVPSSVCVVPVIPPVQKKEISDWVNNIDDFATVDLNQFPESGNRMLPVLEKIANLIECPTLYELIKNKLN